MDKWAPPGKGSRAVGAKAPWYPEGSMICPVRRHRLTSWGREVRKVGTEGQIRPSGVGGVSTFLG